MALFSFLRKPRINELDIEEVRRRVHGIREVDGTPPSSLADLFVLVGETDAPRPRRSFTEAPPEPERVMPDQVPSTGAYQWER